MALVYRTQQFLREKAVTFMPGSGLQQAYDDFGIMLLDTHGKLTSPRTRNVRKISTIPFWIWSIIWWYKLLLTTPVLAFEVLVLADADTAIVKAEAMERCNTRELIVLMMDCPTVPLNSVVVLMVAVVLPHCTAWGTLLLADKVLRTQEERSHGTIPWRL